MLIVESPTKVKTIQNFLPPDFFIASTKGHICTLPKTGTKNLGIDLTNFTPTYELMAEKKALVKTLVKQAKGCEAVYLATDHDREGEAISYDVQQIIQKQLKRDINFYRVYFNEITKAAVVNALDNPTTVNLALVKSQNARRMIDRILGFLLSDFLRKKIQSRSAGRVQSVALKKICELQSKIDKFVAENYYAITVNALPNWEFTLTKYQNKRVVINEGELYDKVSVLLKNKTPLKYHNCTFKQRQLSDIVPLTTTRLLQLASVQLGYSIKHITQLAQQLYEGININGVSTGLITYTRTDSTRLSNEFVKEALSYCQKNYPSASKDKFLQKQAKSKKLVQDAHEAIRPVSFNFHFDKIKSYLNSYQYRLYKLIYTYTLACFCKAPLINSRVVELLMDDFIFTRGDNEVAQLGYYAVLGVDGNLIKANPVSFDTDLTKFNQPCADYKIIKKSTKPPAPYSESRLIKLMDDLEIGRPSTYASISLRLQESNYCDIVNKKILLTDRGSHTNAILQENFIDIINENFTAEIEKKLDKVADGKLDYHQLTKNYYDLLLQLLDKADEKVVAQKGLPTGRSCESCQVGKLIIKKGRFGDFIGCSNYPACNFTERIAQVNKTEELVEKTVLENKNCPCFSCNQGVLLVRQSRAYKKTTSNFFIGCTNYPDCKLLIALNDNTKKIITDLPCHEIQIKLKEILTLSKLKKEKNLLDKICPRCNKSPLIERFSPKTKQKFIGCSSFPKCRFIASDLDNLVDKSKGKKKKVNRASKSKTKL